MTTRREPWMPSAEAMAGEDLAALMEDARRVIARMGPPNTQQSLGFYAILLPSYTVPVALVSRKEWT